MVYCQQENKLKMDYFVFTNNHKWFNIIRKKEVYIMLRYKMNVLEELKKAGYNSTRILKENVLSQSAVQKIRHNEMVGLKTIEQLCGLLNCQPCDIMEYVPNVKES